MARDPLVPILGGHRLAGRQESRGIRFPRAPRLEIGRGARIKGNVVAPGSLYIEPFVTVAGCVRSAGRLVVGAHGAIHGPLIAALDLHLLPGTRVAGDVTAGLDVHLHAGCQVAGRIRAGGDVVVHGAARTGPIEPGGRLTTRPAAAHEETHTATRHPIAS